VALQQGPRGSPYASKKRFEEQLFILSRAIQQSPNALLIARVDGAVVYVNPSFTELTGFKPDEVVGENPASAPFTGNVAEKYKGLWGTLREGREWRAEVQDTKKNGETYWAWESISPILGPEGDITHFLVIRQDITQQKLDQEALLESEERFRQIAEMTGEWLWEQDPQGHYLYCSSAVREILGYRPEELIGRRYPELLMPEECSKRFGKSGELAELGKGYCRLLNHYRHKNGQEVFTESTGAPILDDKGKVIKWRGVDHNVTARKHYEDALRLRNRAIEAANVGISISDAQSAEHPNIYVNPALCRITGYSKEELLGQNWAVYCGSDTDRNTVEAITTAMNDGRGYEATLKNYRKSGAPFWNELLIAPVRDDRGRLTHFVGIQTDVTERRQAEEERRELEIARQIQLSLLPKAPRSFPGVDVGGICVPASHVGGDYFDFFHVRDHLDVVIADVSGHSVGAALIMSEARSTLRAECRNAQLGRVNNNPGEILKLVNELLFEDLDGADLFVSMFYLRFQPEIRELRYANAGHNCPLLLRSGTDQCESLDADGLILGVRKQHRFEEKCIDLAPGDRILLYTDGITESQNRDGDFFAVQRLAQLFAENRRLPPQEAVQSLLDALCTFSEGAPCPDDVTLVVLEAT
jgi:phosphoserine phosphatase RsbU/P